MIEKGEWGPNGSGIKVEHEINKPFQFWSKNKLVLSESLSAGEKQFFTCHVRGSYDFCKAYISNHLLKEYSFESLAVGCGPSFFLLAFFSPLIVVPGKAPLEDQQFGICSLVSPKLPSSIFSPFTQIL